MNAITADPQVDACCGTCGSRGDRIAFEIACTLGAGDFKERVAGIRDLASRALIRSERKPLQLSLTYTSEALAEVEQLVVKESECCSFLDFDMRRSANAVQLHYSASRGAGRGRRTLRAFRSRTREGGGMSEATKRNPPNFGAVKAVNALGLGVAACAACCAPLLVAPILGLVAAGGAGLALAGQIGLGVVVAAGLAFYVLARRRSLAAKRAKRAKPTSACDPSTGCNPSEASKPSSDPRLLPSDRNS